MSNRYEAEEFNEAFDSFHSETEEEARRSRRRPVARRRRNVRRRPPLRRHTPKRRPRIRFPLQAFPAAVLPVPQPQPPKEPQSQPSPESSSSAGTPPEPRDTDRSMEGSEHTRWIQVSLNKVLGGNLPVDGVMDEKTREAVRAFQQRENLPVTGIVGPDTEQALIAATRNTGASAPESAAPDNQPEEAKSEEFYFESEPFELYSEFDEHIMEAALLEEAEAEFDTEFDMESEYEEESEFSLSQLPQSVLTVLGSGFESPALKLAVAFGYRDETQLTNLIFYARHPERDGRSLSKGEPGYSQLAKEWITIRDSLVRPLLSSPASAPSSTAPAPSSGTSGGLDIVSVRGIRVARQIAPQIESLLAAATADGIKLGGGGYRSAQSQIELRRKHCGPTDYDIYEKPSSQCKPPTARPGKSNHEKGLAIDFTYNGRTIGSHDNPGFKWLAANAARFGLYNLPSEPWHWSINGN